MKRALFIIGSVVLTLLGFRWVAEQVASLDEIDWDLEQ